MICEKCGKELNENEVCSCEQEIVLNEEGEEVVDEPNNWLVILSAIIYPVLAVGFGVFLYIMNSTGIVNLILTIALGGCFAVCMLIGGFYFILIPLPYVFFYKFGGVNKPSLELWKKILLGVGAVASIVLAVASLFVIVII